MTTANLTTAPPVPGSAPVANGKETARLVFLHGLLDQWDADAAARHEAKQSGKALGPVTGLWKLDQALGGALGPGLHILHGVPGAGKTALALQIAATCGCPCLYVTCEMSALELLRRVTARVTSTFLGKFKTGELSPNESHELVSRAAHQVRRLALLDATQAPAPPLLLRDMAKTMREELDRENPHLLIIVDSLHSWAESLADGAPEYEALNTGLVNLRQITAQLNCPVLAIAERNRASMKDGGLNAGAGSRKIEYGAESVIDLDVGKDANGKEAGVDANGEKPLLVRIAKNRNGATTKGHGLLFHGALQRYKETGF